MPNSFSAVLVGLWLVTDLGVRAKIRDNATLAIGGTIVQLLCSRGYAFPLCVCAPLLCGY